MRTKQTITLAAAAAVTATGLAMAGGSTAGAADAPDENPQATGTGVSAKASVTRTTCNGGRSKGMQTRISSSPFTFAGMFYRVATAGWHAGVTPGVIVRTCGPFSRRFTRGYAERRLHKSLGLPREESDAFEPYMHQCLGGKGSGEVRCRCSA